MLEVQNLATVRKLLIALVAIWLLWRIAGWFWMFVTPNSSAISQPVQWYNTAPSSPQSAQRSGFSSINLFDAEGGELLPAQPILSELDSLNESSLSLKLNAVVASENADFQVAIIESSGAQALYRIGESLPVRGEVTLVEVYEKTAVISNNGSLEKLVLDEHELQGVEYRMPSTSTPVIESVEVTSAQGGLSNVSQFIRFQPVLNGRRMESVKLHPGDNARVFEMLQLQSGDELLSINGIPVARLRGARELQTLFSNDQDYNLELSRDGEVLSVTVEQAVLLSFIK